MRKINFVLILIIMFSLNIYSQNSDSSEALTKLTVDKIMRDPKWIGSPPEDIHWSDDGERIYFKWNPDNNDGDSLYYVSRDGGKPEKVSFAERMKMPAFGGSYNKERTKKVYEKNGDLFFYNIEENKISRLTNTVAFEYNPVLSNDEKSITYLFDGNLFSRDLKEGKIIQLTNFINGEKPKENVEPKNKEEKYIKEQELSLIKVLRERKEKKEKKKKQLENEKPNRPKEIYIKDKTAYNIQLSPDKNFITFLLAENPKGVKNTIVPNYVTESGFTEDIPGRPNVGSEQTSYEFGIYNRQKDSVYYLKTDDIPGINKKAEFLKGYPDSTVKADSLKKGNGKAIIINGPWWSGDGKYAVLEIRSLDNKDRWIMLLNPENGNVRDLDHQHDEAWIAGPGIPWWIGEGSIGWMPDNKRVWFQSEETGFSHLFTVDVETEKKEELTKGSYEVFDPKISRNKKYWFFTSSKVHPGERQFYKMPINGGEAVRLTNMEGNNEVTLSPDDEMMAIRYSYINKPWELFIKQTDEDAKPKQITHSLSDEFKSYPWRAPEIITFTASDGAKVYARLFKPDNPKPNSPAVLFVHGAGYLQNAHKWWSDSYFREYMFNNLLAENGYYVLAMDYRGSAGYGRDWRTAIYRNMGGKDLSDEVDGAKYLIKNFNVDSKKVGIYGGSYGGFITLMAMFKDADVFKAGAALRSVTDWAHYNHGYTANILNIPYKDSIAYKRSSPIYFAEGLKGHLLICHGIIDQNVHFQDVVRLTQRLIELGKKNWQLAVYPLEGHSFVEPSSWQDEYMRVFKLFEENLK